MLSLQSLSFIIQDQKVFENISITLFPSSIVYLKGKNGSGKTSLLRILAGIQKPTKGIITWLQVITEQLDWRMLVQLMWK